MVQTKNPKRIWDCTIELASIVRSHVALDLIKLENEIPETNMMGQTVDISFICEHEWYSWVYFNDKDRAQFMDQKIVLGRYLGPTEPEVGSVFTTKILTANGEVVRRNSLRRQTPAKLSSDENRKERDLFIEAVSRHLGEPLKEESEFTTSFGIYVINKIYFSILGC
jgi:hypothetical protein